MPATVLAMIWLCELDIYSLVNNFYHKVLNLKQKNLAKAC